MAERQVYSAAAVAFDNYENLSWNWTGASDLVPRRTILDITALTLAYVPQGEGTVGRADITGRNSNKTAVWRLQIVYVEPKKTVHLPFPLALRLEEGGHVEIGFVNDGPGSISLSANGRLVDA